MSRFDGDPIPQDKPKDKTFEEWAIVCPGKSAETLDLDKIKASMPLIAVNAAIGLCNPDVWCISKSVETLDDALQDFGLKTLDVIASRGEMEVWARASVAEHSLPEGVCASTYPNRASAMTDLLLGFKTRKEWSRVPWLGAVAIAYSKGGRKFTVYGADMHGTGYAGIEQGPNHWTSTMTDEQYRRWRMERSEVAYAQADAAPYGIEIELVKAEPKAPQESKHVESTP